MNNTPSKIDMTFLTPSSQTIRQCGGKVLFEGREFTFFSRIGTVLNRQLHKLLRLCRLISKDTLLTNEDALKATKKNIEIASRSFKDEPDLLRSFIKNTQGKICELAKCLSKKSEIQDQTALLKSCQSLIDETQKAKEASKTTIEDMESQIKDHPSTAIPPNPDTGASITPSDSPAQGQSPSTDATKTQENQPVFVPSTPSEQIKRAAKEYLGPAGEQLLTDIIHGATIESFTQKQGDLFELNLQENYFHQFKDIPLITIILHMPKTIKIKFSESKEEEIKIVTFVEKPPYLNILGKQVILSSISFTKEDKVIIKTLPLPWVIGKSTKFAGYDFEKGVIRTLKEAMVQLDPLNFKLMPVKVVM